MGDCIRYAMVGGGPGAFIGEVHRKAAQLDGHFELVAGAFSQNHEKSLATGAELGLDRRRVYPSWEELLEAEKALPEDERVQMIAVVTPNDTHVPVSMAALEAGFHVMCDKPAGRSLAEVVELAGAIAASDCHYGLTHTYLGYPMVREARELVASGKFGPIKKVLVTYPQGWLAQRLEETGHKQAAWRNNPKIAGAGTLGDVGTHASTLAEFIVDSPILSVCADTQRVVQERMLDDDTSALFRLANGAKGVLTASQICAGEVNALTISVYGDKGGLQWTHADPNTLIVRLLGEPETRRIAGSDQSYLSAPALAMCRTPAGHPEGFIEAFANLYRAMAVHIRGQQRAGDEYVILPGISEGLSGLAFIEAALASQPIWTDISRMETRVEEPA